MTPPRGPVEQSDREALVSLLVYALLVLALVFLSVSPASAAPPDTRTTPLPSEPPPSLLRCQRAHVLPEGVVAPCSGLLVPEPEAREAALCVGVGLPTCRVELAECLDVGAVEQRKCSSLLAADADEIAALRQALGDARRPAARPWYEHPIVVGLAAGVVGVGVGVAIGWAVTR